MYIFYFVVGDIFFTHITHSGFLVFFSQIQVRKSTVFTLLCPKKVAEGRNPILLSYSLRKFSVELINVLSGSKKRGGIHFLKRKVGFWSIFTVIQGGPFVNGQKIVFYFCENRVYRVAHDYFYLLV